MPLLAPEVDISSPLSHQDCRSPWRVLVLLKPLLPYWVEEADSISYAQGQWQGWDHPLPPFLVCTELRER